MAINPIRRPPHLPAEAKRRFSSTWALPESHPRHRLLLAWYSWWFNCVGRELRWPGYEDQAVDLEWWSSVDHKSVKFSDTAYEFLMLQGLFEAWNLPAAHKDRSAVEGKIRRYLSVLNPRLLEGRQRAEAERNLAMLVMIDHTIGVAQLAAECLRHSTDNVVAEP